MITRMQININLNKTQNYTKSFRNVYYYQIDSPRLVMLLLFSQSRTPILPLQIPIPSSCQKGHLGLESICRHPALQQGRKIFLNQAKFQHRVSCPYGVTSQRELQSREKKAASRVGKILLKPGEAIVWHRAHASYETRPVWPRGILFQESKKRTFGFRAECRGR